jgi:RNA polymerase sigma-70 factor, ECF subfamily
LPAGKRKEDNMAVAAQLALMHESDTENWSREARQFADEQQESVAVLDEEETLVVAAKRGEGQAFGILVERYERRILAVARRFTRIREDAEDIVQQSFQKAFAQLHRFEGKSRFSTWLTRIAINEALMFLRRGRGVREISIDDTSGNEETALWLEIPDSRIGPESSFLQDERSRILFAAMKQLTPGVRKAIELRDLDELSTEEAARVLGLSAAAVKARVFHGRRKLRQVLKGESGRISRRRNLRARREVEGLSPHELVCDSCD